MGSVYEASFFEYLDTGAANLVEQNHVQVLFGGSINWSRLRSQVYGTFSKFLLVDIAYASILGLHLLNARIKFCKSYFPRCTSEV